MLERIDLKDEIRMSQKHEIEEMILLRITSRHGDINQLPLTKMAINTIQSILIGEVTWKIS